MRKKRKNKSRFPRGRKYDYMLKYALSLGFKDVSEAISAAGSGRIFRNEFKKWTKYKRFK